MNEKFSPELLEHKTHIVDCILEQIKEMASFKLVASSYPSTTLALQACKVNCLPARVHCSWPLILNKPLCMCFIISTRQQTLCVHVAYIPFYVVHGIIYNSFMVLHDYSFRHEHVILCRCYFPLQEETLSHIKKGDFVGSIHRLEVNSFWELLLHPVHCWLSYWFVFLAWQNSICAVQLSQK